MKKILLILILSLLLPLPIKAANLNAALSTLGTNDDWSVVANAALDKAVGFDFLKSSISLGLATDYEKRILAITAQGNDPRTFGNEDFVAKLKTFYDGNQIGRSSLLNDDIFGLLALMSAGEIGTITYKVSEFLQSKQNSDGGWGYSLTSGSDSNMTAMAVTALSKLSKSVSAGVSYLLKCQNADGGFSYIPGQTSDGASTAWVIMGLRAAGQSIPVSAINFLNSLQTSNGSFKWMPGDSGGSGLVTAYAVIALAGKTLPVNVVAGVVQPTSNDKSKPTPNNTFSNTPPDAAPITPTTGSTRPSNIPVYQNSKPVANIYPIESSHPDGTLILSGNTVYQIKNGARWAFTAEVIFKSYGYKFSQVVPANGADMSLPFGWYIDWANGSLVSDGGTVYLVQSGERRGFINAAAFLNKGYFFSQVLKGGTWWLRTGVPIY